VKERLDLTMTVDLTIKFGKDREPQEPREPRIKGWQLVVVLLAVIGVAGAVLTLALLIAPPEVVLTVLESVESLLEAWVASGGQ
jgi:hypothetical protein